MFVFLFIFIDLEYLRCDYILVLSHIFLLALGLIVWRGAKTVSYITFGHRFDLPLTFEQFPAKHMSPGHFHLL